MEEKISRIALLIQYDGTSYNGWQIQDNCRTVQGEIENALKILIKSEVRLHASGRTDTGVHALGQVAHCDITGEIDLIRLCKGLNGILNKDITIKNAYHIPHNLHARFSAVQREYLYLIYNYYQKSPFIINRAMWVKSRLDLEYLREASGFLKGEKDFASFCKKTSADENTVRRIDDIEITQQDELVKVRIRGNAFLHNMIRIIIGTILKMHNEGRSADYINEILEQKDRAAGGITAPACGLYLNKVFFIPPLSDMKSAF